jgi:hypothetical protein
VKGSVPRPIGDAGVDPGDLAALIEQVLKVHLEMILGLDKGVVGLRKKRQGLSCPRTLVGAYINDVFAIRTAAFEQGKKRLQPYTGGGRLGSLAPHANVKESQPPLADLALENTLYQEPMRV